jgi:hypothetical protein
MTARERSSTRTSDERLSVRSLWLVTICLAACGGGSTPTGTPRTSLVIISGAGQTDTCLALLQPLVVQLTGPGAAGQPIQFQTTVDKYGRSPVILQRTDTASIPFGTPNLLAMNLVDTTDASGKATVYMRLNEDAPRTALISVSVPALGIADTVSETVIQGAPVGILQQNDTAVAIGSTDSLHAYVYDEFFNPRLADPITYQVVSGPVTVSGTTVTGATLGLAVVGATARGVLTPRLTNITVVPQGTLAFGNTNGIVVSNLDGSQARAFPVAQVGNVRWSPDGTTIVYDNGSRGFSVGSLTLHAVTISDGTTTTIDSGAIGHYWPHYSRDGAWLYWTDILSGTLGYASVLWRAHVDGTMKDSIPGTDSSWTSSPSPDGSQLVYSLLTYSGLRIITLGTGAETTLPVQAFAPRWAPSGTQIAYLAISSGAGGPIDLINADGTGNRVVKANQYDFSVDWSPDGQWLIAQNDQTTTFDIINVATGMTLPLPFTGSTTWSPAFGPKSSLSASRVQHASAYPISHADPMAPRARPRGAPHRR